MIDIIMLILIGLLGLCLGSFMHVVIYRFSPDKTTKQFLYDITFKRSYCPNCKTQLSFLSLIPVMSWLLQKGKCRHCLHLIPTHYVITELVVAIYCMGMVMLHGLTIWTIILIGFGLYFVILAVIDIHYLLLPNSFTLPLMIVGFIFAYFEISSVSLTDALIGAVLGYLLLWLPASLYYLMKKQVGLGGGDIKLLSALGTWVDYTQLPLLLMIASLIGIGYFIVLYFKQSPSRQITKIIPFGPCLLAASYIILHFSLPYSLFIPSFLMV